MPVHTDRRFQDIFYTAFEIGMVLFLYSIALEVHQVHVYQNSQKLKHISSYLSPFEHLQTMLNSVLVQKYYVRTWLYQIKIVI